MNAPVKRLEMADNSRAYNSVWQLRGDAWCRLEEAADRLTRTTTVGDLKDKYVGICRELLATLTPLEPYWAYPGSLQFAKVQRLFGAGAYEKFAKAVARINRALTTESYRTGDVDHAGMDDTDMFPTDPRTLEQQPVTRREQLYFEVLIVEKMTEAQEQALRAEVRSWRRPDDEFGYELVVVASGDEA
jgi:arginine decarboxylase